MPTKHNRSITCELAICAKPQVSWMSARALQTGVGAENGAPPLKPRLPRALCGLFAGMDDGT